VPQTIRAARRLHRRSVARALCAAAIALPAVLLLAGLALACAPVPGGTSCEPVAFESSKPKTLSIFVGPCGLDGGDASQYAKAIVTGPNGYSKVVGYLNTLLDPNVPVVCATPCSLNPYVVDPLSLSVPSGGGYVLTVTEWYGTGDSSGTCFIYTSVYRVTVSSGTPTVTPTPRSTPRPTIGPTPRPALTAAPGLATSPGSLPPPASQSPPASGPILSAPAIAHTSPIGSASSQETGRTSSIPPLGLAAVAALGILFVFLAAAWVMRAPRV
jgi:hypothetical protein